MVRNGESSLTLREKVFGYMPNIEVSNYKDGPILMRTVHWPWFRVVMTGRAVDDHHLTVPKRFGFTYYDFDCDAFFYHLYPFNFIIALARRVYRVFSWELPHEFMMWETKWRMEHGKKPPKRGRDAKGRFKKR